MKDTRSNRPLLHYSLIAATLLIQVVIAVFIYNEYFNQKKLETIESQLRDSRTLEKAAREARTDLLQAQNQLQFYMDTQRRENLEAYFASLRKLSRNLDSISASPDLNPELAKLIQRRKSELTSLPDLDGLIRSVYQESQKPKSERKPIVIKEINIPAPATTYRTDIELHADTLAKKPLLSRLKDAINNESEVQREVVLVTTNRTDSVDTSKIRTDLDSIVRNLQNHYQDEIQKYQAGIASARQQSDNLYRTYDQLIRISNNWMEVYTYAIGDFNAKLQEQLDEQYSSNAQIRRYTLVGLIVLMFLVLLLIIYFTRQSFQYQRELRAANAEIRNNLKFKNRVLGMLSHEVLAPLKIINLFIDRIGRKNSNPSIESYLQSMKYTNNSLLIQASQILEYAKNQERKPALHPENFNLYTETQSIFQVFKPFIESRNNNFEVENEIPAETQVFTDKILIYQLFTNILGNANKFTENGQITVSAKLRKQENSKYRMHVKVADTGSGISRADLKRIFEPYYQGQTSAGLENIGAGLGLNLCRETVELLGGQIWAESQLGKGTTINFYINLDKNLK